MPRYRFAGPEPEDFPDPPIARCLQPGDVIEVDEPVEHVRLELVTETKAAAKKTSGKED